MDKKISIIIVTYNGFEYIDRCVRSIVENPYKDVQIIVVDNGSNDGTPSRLQEKYPEVELVPLTHNIGPAAARNEGIQKAKGKYILFLDNDTEIDEKTIPVGINLFNEHPEAGILQSKLVFQHDTSLLDCTGEFLGQWGFLVHRTEVGQKDDNVTESEIIFSAKSAGMWIRKDTLDAIGSFDPDYFIYLEETDLAWRSWMAGYTALYAPHSVVHHTSGTSSIILPSQTHDYNGKFHGCKNYIQTLIKNLEMKNLLQILPLHVVLWTGLAYYSLLQRKTKPWLWIHAAIWWNCTHIFSTLKKRAIIQSRRKQSDDQFFPFIMRKKSLSYYTNKVRSIKIGNAEGFIKS